MNVGICKIQLNLPASRSAKDKRNVIGSITTKVRNKFNVSIAEIDPDQGWRSAILAVTCVSSSSSHVNKMLSRVLAFIENCRDEAVTADYDIEILTGI